MNPLDPFSLRFMQLAAAEVALLSVLAAVLGAQIVLRGLAFFSHAVGAGAFPGLVLASAWGIQPQLAAEVEELDAPEDEARYRVRDGGREIRLTFVTRGDGRHLESGLAR